MSQESGLICAYRLDTGTGPLDWGQVREEWKGDGVLWVHLLMSEERAQEWLSKESGLDPLVVEALLADETRPRCEPFGEGLIVNLRGVNLNPGADPEDMVSIRLWVDSRVVVSVRLRRLMAVEDIRSEIERGHGPRTTCSFIDELTSRLGDRMWPVIDDLEDRLAEVEDVVLTTKTRQTRTVLATIRQQAIGLRRFIGPQREALARLSSVDTAWMDDMTRRHLRESFDRFTRGVEDLDAIRERAAVVQDELTNHLGDEMNRRMYALSLIAGVFLPLGFITGLLGINVGGIPGTDISWAFLAVCVIIVVVVVFEVVVFRRLKWF